MEIKKVDGGHVTTLVLLSVRPCMLIDSMNGFFTMKPEGLYSLTNFSQTNGKNNNRVTSMNYQDRRRIIMNLTNGILRV